MYFMMDEFTLTTEYWENKTSVISHNTSVAYYSDNDRSKGQIILVIQSAIASFGIIANLTVIVVFLNHKKLRRKIPNIFIINQVRISNTISITIPPRIKFRKYFNFADLSENTFQSFNMEVYVETFLYFCLCKKLEFSTFYQISLVEISQRRSDLLTTRNDSI